MRCSGPVMTVLSANAAIVPMMKAIRVTKATAARLRAASSFAASSDIPV
jgi:hypothetical protein